MGSNQNCASPICGFIFDLDGVITDTAEYHYLAWKRLADEEGLPFDRKINEQLRGISRRESLLIILQERELPESQLRAWMERKNRYYLEFIQQISPGDLLPGAKELLEEMRASSLKTAIGSASKNASEVLDRLGIRGLFDAVSDGYSVKRPKPAPDLFLHAAAQLKLQPSVCVVVEDAAAGIQAAQAGGFHTVGIGPKSRVSAAEVIIPSLENYSLDRLLKLLTGGKV